MSITVWMCCLPWGSLLMADAARGCLVPPSSDLIDVNTSESGDGCWGNSEESFPRMSYKSVRGMVTVQKCQRHGNCTKVSKAWWLYKSVEGMVTVQNVWRHGNYTCSLWNWLDCAAGWSESLLAAGGAVGMAVTGALTPASSIMFCNLSEISVMPSKYWNMYNCFNQCKLLSVQRFKSIHNS